MNEVHNEAQDEVNPDEGSEEEFAETVILSEPEATDNVGDVSVEINVEQLIADIEGEKNKDALRKQELRRKLEDMAEERSFEDTYAIEFDSWFAMICAALRCCLQFLVTLALHA